MKLRLFASTAALLAALVGSSAMASSAGAVVGPIPPGPGLGTLSGYGCGGATPQLQAAFQAADLVTMEAVAWGSKQCPLNGYAALIGDTAALWRVRFAPDPSSPDYQQWLWNEKDAFDNLSWRAYGDWLIRAVAGWKLRFSPTTPH